MIDQTAAREAVEAILATWPAPCPGDSWELRNEQTIERDWGWVFFYGSKLYHETGEFRYAVAGNAPFVVKRADGTILETGTAMPVEDYIRRFEQDGTLP